MITFFIMVVGIGLKSESSDSEVVDYILALGLFGFAGGVTNWLAVKMLFDKIPGLIGSGVIPRQFIVIRETVKNTIMKTFFDEKYLGDYIQSRSKTLLASLDLVGRIKTLVSKPDFDATLTTALEEMSTKPEGVMINTFAPMFGGVPGLVPMLKPMIVGFSEKMATKLTDGFDISEFVTVERVRTEIDELMTEKLRLLTPELVKELMEEVIREHLGWLIVWGNVFGGLIGVVSYAVGYGG